ncbi:MAG: lipid A biosynthesis acyltransferase, partial [Schwartzia sp.]|nr:lipid A biosynthesis acyltransferase [Schwartzia sp. (in: firmicutes)]
MLLYYLEKFLSFLCCLLPESVCEWIGKTLGVLTWPLVPAKRRNMAIENVMACLGVPETEAERIAKASWVRFGPMLFEVMRFPKLRGHILERVEFEGLDAMKKSVAEGRGLIIATSHCGNWELLGGALAEAGIPTVGVGMRQKESGSDRFITEYRRLVGMR